MTELNFNCGEFRPGKEPVGVGTSSVVPPVVIPGPTKPFKPPGGTPPTYWKCEETLILCPDGTVPRGPLVVPGVPNARQIIRTCNPCVPGDPHPDCINKQTEATCRATCENSARNDCVIPIPTGEPLPGSSIQPPNPGLFPKKYACIVQSWVWCPDNDLLGGGYLAEIDKTCVECRRDVNGNYTPPGNTPVIPPNRQGVNNNVTCDFDTPQQCSFQCLDKKFPCPQITPTTTPTTTQPPNPGLTQPTTQTGGGTVTINPGQTGPRINPGPTTTINPGVIQPTVTPGPTTTINPGITQPSTTGGTTTTINLGGRPVTVVGPINPLKPIPPVVTGPTVTQVLPPTKPGITGSTTVSPTRTIGLTVAPTTTQGIRTFGTPVPVVTISPTTNGNLSTSATTILHQKFSLFQYPYTQSTKFFQQNFSTVLNPTVPEPVDYIGSRSGTKRAWNEFFYQQVGEQEVVQSFDPILVNAITHLQFVDGQLIPYRSFIDTFRKHIFEGTINEIDPNFYIRQASLAKPFVFEHTNDKNLKERAALGIVKFEAKTVDTSKETDRGQKIRLKRTRALPTDVKASLRIVQSDTDSYEVFLFNNGLVLQDEEGDEVNVELGEGDGYYFPVFDVNNTEFAVEVETEVSSSYFQPPSTRNSALSLLDTPNGFTIAASSVASSSEFESGYDLSSVVPVMFFQLDLTSVGDKPTTEDFITDTSAVFNLVTDVTAINTFLRSYGNSVVRANLDYRDPILQYAKDSSSLNLEQKDFTFRRSAEATSPTDEFILLRNIPFGLVLVPGCGSQHNPFNSRSDIDQVTPTVRRSLTLIPNSMTTDSALEEKFLFDEEGIAKIGLLEEADAQNIIFEFNPSSSIYNNTYFSSGDYFSTQPDRERSFEGKLARVVDDNILSSFGDISAITSWDLFRRFEPDIVGSYYFQYPYVVMESILNGWRGPVVQPVLSKDTAESSKLITPIAEGLDNIILKEEDRFA